VIHLYGMCLQFTKCVAECLVCWTVCLRHSITCQMVPGMDAAV